jgi:hypothetical protein
MHGTAVLRAILKTCSEVAVLPIEAFDTNGESPDAEAESMLGALNVYPLVVRLCCTGEENANASSLCPMHIGH